jgi:hypothetical protein
MTPLELLRKLGAAYEQFFSLLRAGALSLLGTDGWVPELGGELPRAARRDFKGDGCTAPELAVLAHIAEERLPQVKPVVAAARARRGDVAPPGVIERALADYGRDGRVSERVDQLVYVAEQLRETQRVVELLRPAVWALVSERRAEPAFAELLRGVREEFPLMFGSDTELNGEPCDLEIEESLAPRGKSARAKATQIRSAAKRGVFKATLIGLARSARGDTRPVEPSVSLAPGPPSVPKRREPGT